jgi:hypothetical protein
MFGGKWRSTKKKKKKKKGYEDFRLRGKSELKAQCGEQQECSPRGTPLALGPHLAPSRVVNFVLKVHRRSGGAAMFMVVMPWAPIKSNNSAG